MKSAKYLTAYIVPLLAVWGLLYGGWTAYAVPLFAFGMVPFFDQLLPGSTYNLTDEERQSQLADKLFDWLLYLNIPVVYGIVGLFIYQLNQGTFSSSELTGWILSVGITIGACGINVGHELGHRQNKTEQFLAKVLLLPALYQHFFIEHNRGHHKYVATPEDPATARRGELLYTFWFRSLWGSYRHAWQLERQRLHRAGKAVFSWNNEMIRFTITQAGYVLVVALLTPSLAALSAVVLAGITGVLLLETVNYIEHYGLVRQRTESGRYERVQPHHSWNANYPVGRIMLYELTRHSDHHFLADKKYQILDHYDHAPELPAGYPASMLMALVPPVWFWVMHRKLEKPVPANLA